MNETTIVNTLTVAGAIFLLWRKLKDFDIDDAERLVRRLKRTAWIAPVIASAMPFGIFSVAFLLTPFLSHEGSETAFFCFLFSTLVAFSIGVGSAAIMLWQKFFGSLDFRNPKTRTGFIFALVGVALPFILMLWIAISYKLNR